MIYQQITAAEAFQHNFVTEVIPDKNIDQVWTKIYNWANLPPNTMLVIKSLIRQHQKETLHKVRDEILCKCKQNFVNLYEDGIVHATVCKKLVM